MVDQEMIFRAGLMLAVLMLAGLFGTHIAGRINEEDDLALERTTNDLGRILESVVSSEPGSSIVVHFGEVGEQDGRSVEFPGTIDGERMELQFHHGLIVLRCGGMKEIVSRSDDIISSVPPVGPVPISDDLIDVVRSNTHGFTLLSPCSLVIEKPLTGSEDMVFIYPLDILQDPILDELKPMVDLIEDQGDIIPGWNIQAEISHADIIEVNENGLILGPSEFRPITGSCCIPVPFDRSYEIDQQTQLLSGTSFAIILVKKSVIQEDGIITISSSITITPSSDHAL